MLEHMIPARNRPPLLTPFGCDSERPSSGTWCSLLSHGSLRFEIGALRDAGTVGAGCRWFVKGIEPVNAHLKVLEPKPWPSGPAC